MKIMVPVDGSKYSMEGVMVAADFAKGRGASIFLMHVTPHIADIDLEVTAHNRDDVVESIRQRGEEVLDKAKEFLKSKGADCKAALATAASAADAIVKFAEEEKIDLVIIGSRGLTGVKKFLLGSTASNVVRHAPCSVYVVKMPAE